MIELVVVILLIGILAIAIVPRFSDSPITVGAQADQIASDIRYVQSLSMTRGVRYCFNIVSTTTYDIRTSNCSTAVTHPASGATTITLDNVTYSASGLSTTYIEFDTKGRPTTITPSTGNATLTLTGGGESRTVTVSGETGRVAVQ
jgi:MSHA pilin protein MshC